MPHAHACGTRARDPSSRSSPSRSVCQGDLSRRGPVDPRPPSCDKTPCVRSEARARSPRSPEAVRRSTPPPVPSVSVPCPRLRTRSGRGVRRGPSSSPQRSSSSRGARRVTPPARPVAARARRGARPGRRRPLRADVRPSTVVVSRAPAVADRHGAASSRERPSCRTRRASRCVGWGGSNTPRASPSAAGGAHSRGRARRPPPGDALKGSGNPLSASGGPFRAGANSCTIRPTPLLHAPQSAAPDRFAEPLGRH